MRTRALVFVFVLCLFQFVTQQVAAAEPVRLAKIETTDQSDASAYHFLLAYPSGRAYKLKASQPEMLAVARQALSQGRSIVVHEEDGFVARIELLDLPLAVDGRPWALPAAPSRAGEREVLRSRLMSYEPTQVPDYDLAFELFDEVFAFERSNNSDNCFNRAHYWSRSFEMKGYKSGKIFLFFTEEYRRRVEGRWWFHVAPWLPVRGEGQLVLDPTFLEEPYTISEWLEHFTPRRRSACSSTESYSRMDLSDRSKDCIYIKSTMYHWVPDDLEDRMDNWRCYDFRVLQQALPRPFGRSWSALRGFVPEDCD